MSGGTAAAHYVFALYVQVAYDVGGALRVPFAVPLTITHFYRHVVGGVVAVEGLVVVYVVVGDYARCRNAGIAQRHQHVGGKLAYLSFLHGGFYRNRQRSRRVFVRSRRHRDDHELIQRHFGVDNGDNSVREGNYALFAVRNGVRFVFGVFHRDSHGQRFVIVDGVFFRGDADSYRFGHIHAADVALPVAVKVYVRCAFFVGIASREHQHKHHTQSEYKRDTSFCTVCFHFFLLWFFIL